MNRPAHVVQTESAEQTRRFGRWVGQSLAGGEVIALIGPLGAGKTQFVKGLATGSGRTEPADVTSPTFVLVNEYPGRVYVYHLDAYRLRGGEEMARLGFEEMITPSSTLVVEWADRVAEVLPEDRLTIRFEATGETSRRLTLEAGGSTSRRLLAAIANDERRAKGDD